MAIDMNMLIEKAHDVAKPYIMQGLQKGIEKVDEVVEESGTIADNLLWDDVKEAFQESA